MTNPLQNAFHLSPGQNRLLRWISILLGAAGLLVLWSRQNPGTREILPARDQIELNNVFLWSDTGENPQDRVRSTPHHESE